MITLTEITNKIEALNSTHFQEMCDEIIIREYPKHKSFSRSGMAKSVDETKVGTPDSYIFLDNGNFIFNEHTKDKRRKFSKIKSDFESCINENKVGAAVDFIQEINFCISFTISKEQTLELDALCKASEIQMGLWDIDRLARNILYKNPDLASQYLAIPLEKSQWTILKSFVKNYNKAGKSIAAPLDNPFYFRESETTGTLSSVTKHHVTVISGSPGVGKSKLVVETLINLQQRSSDLIVWVNSFDSASIIDDLSSKLSNEQSIILFIDDAHRLSHFQQILKFLRNSVYENVKLIVTVRDYSLSEFVQSIYSYDYNIITISGLKGDKITEIIANPPFNIISQSNQQKLLSLGRGNLRLILMLAGLETSSDEVNALNNSEEAFDFYFRSLLDDAKFLSEPNYIKTMAITTFFNTVNLSDHIFLDKLAASFKLNKDTLYDCYVELEKFELISIYNEEVQVSEQNLGFYLFNKAFFKDGLLDFENLLSSFYPKFRERFKECVISANNNFGHNNLVANIETKLVSYLNFNDLPRDEAISFYDLFWFAIPDRTISFIIENSLSGEIVIDSAFNFNYKTNDFAYQKNSFLSLLVPFLREHTTYFSKAVEAGLAFTRRNPDKASEFLHILKEYLPFGRKDSQHNYYKHQELLRILKNGFQEKKQLEKELFYEISKFLLKHSFQNYEPIHNDNTISLYTYSQQSDQVIENLRSDIWNLALNNFDEYPTQTLTLLNSCASQHPDNNKELMLFDLEYIIEFIGNKLMPDKFEHCLYVHKQIWWFRRSDVSRDFFDEILNRYNSFLFRFYESMNFEKLHGLYRFENDSYLEYELYNDKKAFEIEAFLEDHYQNDVQRFYTDYSKILKLTDDKWSLRESPMDIAVAYFFKRDSNNILTFINVIASDNNTVNYTPYRSFKLFEEGFEIYKMIYENIQSKHFKGKALWITQLFELSKSTRLIEYFSSKIVLWAKEINENCSISYKNLEKYVEFNKELYNDIIPIILKKINAGHQIRNHSCFTNSVVKSMRNNLGPLKALYFIQDAKDHLFDYKGETFASICKIEPVFLKEYFENIYSIPNFKRPSRNNRDHFNLLWSNPDVINHIDEVLALIIEKESYYGIADHNAAVLFKNLDVANKKLALKTLMNFALDNSGDRKSLDAVMDIVHKNFPKNVDDFIRNHILKTKSLKSFKDVRWIISQGVWSGNVNPDLIRAKRWEEILSTVNKMKDEIELVPIKNYISEVINRYKEYANYKRRWN